MNATLIWNGAAFIPCPGVPVSDRGLRYGMALFESLAVRGGKVEFLAAHLLRLEAACRQLGWPVEHAALARAGEQLGQMAGPAFARIYVTAGDGAPLAPVAAPRVLLFAEPRAEAPAQRLRVGGHAAPFLPVLGGLKTANYWANIAALEAARAAGQDEALLFNSHGELISGCMANVFVELDGAWVTPPTACGARAGVVRGWVLRRSPVVERPITRDEVRRATACFLTSCWAGIAPVATLDGAPLDTAFAEALRAEFFTATLE